MSRLFSKKTVRFVLVKLIIFISTLFKKYGRTYIEEIIIDVNKKVDEELEKKIGKEASIEVEEVLLEILEDYINSLKQEIED